MLIADAIGLHNPDIHVGATTTPATLSVLAILECCQDHTCRPQPALKPGKSSIDRSRLSGVIKREHMRDATIDV
jgi:hypothetical protein